VNRIDLFLGGDLGLWSLGRVSPQEVGQVFTPDAKIIAAAEALGIRATNVNANTIELIAAPIGFSVHYPRMIKPHLIEKYQKIYNLHPGFLPWGRGYYPVFWALWEGTPAGATLHEIAAELDEGPVVAQSRVSYHEHDTGGSLHARVRKAEESLFLAYWPRVVSGEKLSARTQDASGGSYHLKQEFFALKQQAPWEKMSGAELVRLARCLTFPGFSGLEIDLEGKKFELRLEQLASENQPVLNISTLNAEGNK